ncbi:MAG: hypothetical protein HY943_02615 [Gammaproteobacteria bacterium]|nr:hypothetical protein [Gammaproteobacteria bacterium]
MKAHLVCGAVLAAIMTPAQALTGRVLAATGEQGLADVQVSMSLPAGTPGPGAVTVFTDASGTFRLPDEYATLPAGAQLAATKLGFRQVQDPAAPLTLRLEPAPDIAAQVPASAWLGRMPAGDARNVLVTSCSSCHQVPSPRMREYAAQIEAVRGGPEGDAKALAAWRKLVRHEAWRVIVKYMRTRHYAIFPDESAMSLDAIDWPTAMNPDYNFYNARQGELVAQFLADNFPHTTATLAPGAYAAGAPLGVTAKTVIREYAFPDAALVREIVPAPQSPYLWGADVQRNRIVRLDPRDGATKWFPVSFDAATGPHTIAPDGAGSLWVSMVDNGQFGRFDPASEQWTLWTLRPKNLPDSASLGGAALVHDMSIDEHGRVSQDAKGRIWLTLVGSNQLGTIAPASGDVEFHDTFSKPGLSAINHLIYSTVLSPDGTCAWFSQVNGDVGCLDTATAKISKRIAFPEGSGPRRMTRDGAGNLWVALFGSGQVTKIDMARGERVATYDLPDRAAAPYAVAWDEQRQAVWVATANADAIYRLDAASGKLTVYPLPRPMAYLRQIGVDPEHGRLVATYANYPAGSGPSYAVVIEVGDR